jgi:hypothetical protein
MALQEMREVLWIPDKDIYNLERRCTLSQRIKDHLDCTQQASWDIYRGPLGPRAASYSSDQISV